MIELTVQATRKLDRFLRAEGFNRQAVNKTVWVVKIWLKGVTEMNELKANDHQPGGSHYRKHSTEYQHWDWVVHCDIHYLLAASSKYLCRWKDKGKPLEDLRKAAHYLDKCIECAPIIMAYRSRVNINKDWVISETYRFIADNQIIGVEGDICMAYANWSSVSELRTARKSISGIIEAYHNNESIATGQVNPLKPPAHAKAQQS